MLRLGQPDPRPRRVPVRFFYLGRLLQGPDLRLELRNFLPIPSLRFPVFAQLLGTLDGLLSPLITTADDLRVLKHWMARAW